MTDPQKHVEVFPPPEEEERASPATGVGRRPEHTEEPPEPSFKQYFVGWGLIFLALVAVGVLLGVLMRVLR
jgi:hypothetical protein